MTFAHPYLLLLLLVLPLVAWLRARRAEPPAFVYSSLQLFRPVLEIAARERVALPAALRWLALACLLIALAQPRLTRSEMPRATASGVDIVVAFDLSGSMAAEDFQVRGQRINRVEMAREVLKQFIARRPNDRIGLVAFATEAYIACPLTLDHEFLLQNLERLGPGTINPNQTAIGSALSTAVNRLWDTPARSKLIVLMTDGQNNAGKIAPLTAAEAARALRIRVYTIGIGTRGVAPMPVFMGGRKVGYQPAPVDIDEETLQKIADLTGGKYYRADNAERFREIYDEIDRLEKTEVEVKRFVQHTELFPQLVLAGLVLLLLELVLAHTAYRRLP